MHTFFLPGINFINRLKYPQKFGLVAFLLFTFILILFFALIWGLNIGINFTEKERTGLVYIDPLKDLLRNVERHRGLVNGYLRGDKELKTEMNDIKIQINKNINNINNINRKNKDIFRISEEFSIIIQDWEELEKETLNLAPEESFKRHSIIVEEILVLIVNIADRSNLTIDPEIDKFYMGRSVTVDIPELTDRIGRVRGIGIGVAAKGQLSDVERREIITQNTFVEAKKIDVNRNSEKIIRENPWLEERLSRYVQDINDSIDEFQYFTNREIIEPDTINIDPREYFDMGTGAIRSVFRLYELEIYMLDDIFFDRINQLKTFRNWLSLFTLLVLLGLLYLFACFTFSIVNAVRYLKNRAMKVSSGNLDVKIDLNSRDELKDLSDSMNSMIANLRFFINREKTIRDVVLNAIEAGTREETMKKIVLNTGKIFNVDRCYLVEYDDEKNVYAPIEKNAVYTASLEVFNPTGIKFSIEEMEVYSDIVFGERRSLVVNDINKINLPEPTVKLMKRFNSKSYVIAPLIYAGIPIGMLIIAMEREYREFSGEEVALLESIASQAAILLNQSRLNEEVLRLNEELKTSLKLERILRKITSEASTLERHERIDEYITEQLIQIFDADKVLHLHVMNESLNWEVKQVKTGLQEKIKGQCFVPAEYAKEIIPPPEEIISINNINTEIKNEHLKKCLENEGIGAFIAYPTSRKILLQAEKKVVELTLIASEKPKAWTLEEKNLFRIIMDTITIVTLETIQRTELDDIKKTFVATLAHDLRSPMIAEQKALEYMLSPDAQIPENEFNEFLNDIYRTNKDLLKLVDNLMAVYHYESGRLELEKKPENIEQLIKDNVQAMQYLVIDRKCSIDYDIQNNLPLVNLDKAEINRVLTNLITNAIKHNPMETNILVSAELNNKSILLSVKDNGEGIPKDVIPEVFQRYPAKKRKIGTGLGLYIAKQVIEAHGGKIWFETHKDKGTTFYFTLPL